MRLVKKGGKKSVQTYFSSVVPCILIQGDTKKRELLKNPTKIVEIQQKKFIDRN
jgi:hypothetical protein